MATASASGPFAASGQREHFLVVGHGLCALLAGLVCVLIARWFHRAGRADLHSRGLGGCVDGFVDIPDLRPLLVR